MRTIACLVLFATAGCVQTGPEVRNEGLSEVIDKIWNALAKHEHLWVDSIEYADGHGMDSRIQALELGTPVTGAKYGMVLRCHVGDLDLKAVSAFRRELKDDPVISHHFPIVHFDLQWKILEQKEMIEKTQLTFEVILVNTGRT